MTESDAIPRPSPPLLDHPLHSPILIIRDQHSPLYGHLLLEIFPFSLLSSESSHGVATCFWLFFFYSPYLSGPGNYVGFCLEIYCYLEIIPLLAVELLNTKNKTSQINSLPLRKYKEVQKKLFVEHIYHFSHLSMSQLLLIANLPKCLSVHIFT